MIESWVITPNLAGDNMTLTATFNSKSSITAGVYQFRFLNQVSAVACPLVSDGNGYDPGASAAILANGFLNGYADVAVGTCAAYFGEIRRVSDNVLIQTVVGYLDRL